MHCAVSDTQWVWKQPYFVTNWALCALSDWKWHISLQIHKKGYLKADSDADKEGEIFDKYYSWIIVMYFANKNVNSLWDHCVDLQTSGKSVGHFLTRHCYSDSRTELIAKLPEPPIGRLESKSNCVENILLSRADDSTVMSTGQDAQWKSGTMLTWSLFICCLTGQTHIVGWRRL